MADSNCPGRKQLQDFLVGALQADRAESLAAHLETCGQCRDTIQTLSDAEDPLVARLRASAPPDVYGAEPPRERFLRRAMEMAGQGSTVAGPSGEGAPESKTLGRLGDYELLTKLGEGGMGAVYKARQVHLDRIVALKVLPGGRSQAERDVARFYREMKAVGRVDHPNVVRAMDAREIDGRPVLVMEYVSGVDLSELGRKLGRLPVAEACELMRQAAMGLQEAHEQGLVHRDIKPSNLMLTPAGVVKILDLGLALFQAADATAEEMTGAGQPMGTVEYMAPEQATDAHQVDIRADVYSLGCTFYRLLMGEPPFGPPKYRTPMEKMLAHLQQPVPPIGEARPDVPAELAGVLGRMLAKSPADRYATPNEVAEAVLPFCAGSDLRRLTQATGGASGGATAGGGTQPLMKSHRTDTRPGQPKAAPQPAGRQPRGRWIALGLGGAAGLVIVLGIWLRVRQPDGSDQKIPLAPGSQITVESDTAPAVTRRGPGLESLRPEDIPPYEREIALLDNDGKLPPKLVAVFGDSRLRHWHEVTALAYCAADKRLVSLSKDGLARLWDVASGKELHRWPAGAMAVSQDGTTIAVALASMGVVVWDAVANREIRTLQPGMDTVIAVALRQDGKLAACALKGYTRLYDLTADEPKATPIEGDLRAMSADGKWLALASGPKTLRLWDVAAAREQGAIDAYAEPSAIFSPEGKYLAVWSRLSNGEHESLGLFDAKSGKEIRRLPVLYRAVSVIFSPDGQSLLATAHGMEAWAWDVATGKKTKSFGLDNLDPHVALTADGKTLAATHAVNCGIRFWDVASTKEVAVSEVGGGLTEAAFSPRDDAIALGGDNGTLWFWNATAPLPRLAAKWNVGPTHTLVYSPDATLLAIAGGNHRYVRVWDVGAGKVSQTLARASYTDNPDIALSPDGKILAASDGNPPQAIRLWDLRDGTPCGMIALPDPKNAGGRGLAFTPDGRRLMIGTLTGQINVWAMPSGRAESPLLEAGGRRQLNRLVFSSEGQLLALAHDYGIALLDVPTRKLLEPPGLQIPALCMALRGDGRLLAYGRSRHLGYGEIRFYDCRERKDMPPLKIGPSSGLVFQIAFSQDGRYLASVNPNGTVYVFDLGTEP